jgi:hypothetical protein
MHITFLLVVTEASVKQHGGVKSSSIRSENCTTFAAPQFWILLNISIMMTAAARAAAATVFLAPVTTTTTTPTQQQARNGSACIICKQQQLTRRLLQVREIGPHEKIHSI